MKKVKWIGLAGMVITVLSMAPVVMADTVQLSTSAYTSYNTGGEFTAVTGQNGTFQTFCVQTGTEFNPYNWGGPTYNYTVSLTSLGGPGYPGAPVAVGQPFSYALSEGTAWLYAQFATGSLANYDFANTGNDRSTDAGILQSAIWELQGGQSYGGYPYGGSGNIYYDEALAHFGGSSAALDAAATLSTDFGTEIMNLSLNGANNSYQNQLIYFPPSPPSPGVPDGGATVTLLSVALFGLGIYRRR
jgi:hypothetical protein